MLPLPRFVVLRTALLLLLPLSLAAPTARAESLEEARQAAILRALDARLETGVLLDRVLPLARLDRFDGSEASPVMDAATWRQGFDELRRASRDPARWPDPPTIDARARELRADGRIPIALFDRAWERIAPAATANGVPEGAAGTWPLERGHAFGAAVLAPPTHRGGDLRFVLDPDLVFTDRGGAPGVFEIDFADGLGFRRVVPGATVAVHYTTTGTHTLTARTSGADGTTEVARFSMRVVALAAPNPDDTLHVTASVAWQGQFGTGDAYVYRAPGHTGITNPVVVIEGFDLDNTMNWDELYTLLNQENLIEDLRADGFDAVVLNFADATLPIQENGLLVAELIQQVNAVTAPSQTIALVGASMGGLCSRYALDWLETNAIAHRVRTWISFDAPHGGADIPLGLQYWINFFAGQSTDAAAFLAILNRPAARQMLIYHYTSPAGATGQADPMRATMLSDFAALGDWPTMPRRVAIANGSGNGTNQGYSPQAQVIRWVYSGIPSVTGNVWALPNAVADTIFAGEIKIIITTSKQTVVVSGTQPWDNAPGGSRASFAELDALTAPYGDIVALHPNHCFIPVVSSLAIPTGNPFFDVAGTPNLVDQTPFDAIYWPATNQEHVLITPENAQWAKDEIEAGTVSVPAPAGIAGGLHLSAGPNPFATDLAVRFTLDRETTIEGSIVGVDGRVVARWLPRTMSAGLQSLHWDGRDVSGTSVPAGIYFVRLTAGSKSAVTRIARMR